MSTMVPASLIHMHSFSYTEIYIQLPYLSCKEYWLWGSCTTLQQFPCSWTCGSGEFNLDEILTTHTLSILSGVPVCRGVTLRKWAAIFWDTLILDISSNTTLMWYVCVHVFYCIYNVSCHGSCMVLNYLAFKIWLLYKKAAHTTKKLIVITKSTNKEKYYFKINIKPYCLCIFAINFFMSKTGYSIIANNNNIQLWRLKNVPERCVYLMNVCLYLIP